MADEKNLGREVTGWTAPPRPDGLTLNGRFVSLEPLDAAKHAADLFRVFDGHDELWDYMPAGPFASSSSFHRWMRDATAQNDPYFFAIRDVQRGKWVGFCSLLRISPEAGSIEVGFITFSPELQRTPAATETMFLLMQWEGVFRQHMVVKGRNRDTAWFAVIDSEWAALKEAFGVWLNPANFDRDGRQKERLADLTALVRVASDPALRR